MKNLRKINLFFSAVVMISVIFLLYSCTFNVSTANISSTEFAKEVPGGQPVKIESTYHPGDGPFHLYVVVSNAPEDTRVKAAWFGIDDSNKSILIDSNTIIMGNNSQVDFSLSLPRPWPVGKYKVDLSLNDKFDRSIPFDVKP
jgi:hypothetical protein